MIERKIKKVAIIYDNTHHPLTTGEYCRRVLQNICEVVHYLPSQLSNIPKDFFDLYLSIDDSSRYVLPQDLRPSAWWVIDTHLQYDWDLQKAHYFDVVFSAQKDGAERLSREGIKEVFWLPLACDPEIHAKIDIAKRFDWCFVGNINCRQRVELIDLLKSKFPCCFVGQAYGQEMAKIFSASKIVFNQSIRNDINMRVFEALSTGSLLITDDLSGNGLEELLREGEDYISYRSHEELVEKMAYYLEFEKERERIAMHGRKTVLSMHSYLHRMKLLVEQTGETLKKAGRHVGDTGGAYFHFARPEVLELVPQGVKRALDIGCAAGELGAGIKREHGAEVTGMEIIPSVAEAAREKLDKIITGDCERLDFNKLFPAEKFDCLILCDILEHLREPENLLRRIKPFLQQDAYVIASIPNVQNFRVVAELIQGNWTYQDMGILDRTHLRFFTRKEIEKLFLTCGFSIEKIVPKYDPNHYAWISAGMPARVNLGGIQVTDLAAKEIADFFVFQYLIVARTNGNYLKKIIMQPLIWPNSEVMP